MTAAVLDIPTTGIAHRAADRRDAWTILGTDVSGASSVRDALDRADLLGWDVRKIGNVTATEITEHGVTTIAMPGTFANVRTNVRTRETEYLATVGNRFRPIAMERHIDALELMAREIGATPDMAGAYKGGARSFLTLRLPKAVSIGGVDMHDMNIAAYFYNDGSAKDSVNLSPVRQWCGNMQSLVIAKAQRSYKIPHLASADKRLGEVYAALSSLLGYQDAFVREAERMLNTKLTLGKFEKVVHQLWTPPVAPNKTELKTWQTRTTTLRTLFDSADTQANIRGTVWAGWNAVGEYLDHYTPRRSDASRGTASLGSAALAMKTKARKLLMLAA
ncbi:DUF932 domain-containing protein [Streptacidiphilus sp. EB103A]|uniref:DUF932 domain-containing protein n=1 Tax=Streptacidiphilus sp. EB103A TaxID=3156275 RepID=UPI003516890E